MLPKSNIKVVALGTDIINKEFVSKCVSKNAIFISRIHKKKGIDRVFLVPESSKYKVYGEKDCGVALNKNKYLMFQNKLIKFS